jgi:hypothetical protein
MYEVYVVCTGNMRNTKTFWSDDLKNRQIGRPRSSWDENIKKFFFAEMGVRGVLESAGSGLGPVIQKEMNFLTT